MPFWPPNQQRQSTEGFKNSIIFLQVESLKNSSMLTCHKNSIYIKNVSVCCIFFSICFCKGLIILVYFACQSRCITAVVPHFFLSSGGTAYCWMSTRNWSFTYWLLLNVVTSQVVFQLKVQFEIQWLRGNEFLKLLVYSEVHYWTHARSKLVMVILWTCPDLCWGCEPPVFVIYRRIIELTFSSDFYTTHTLS